MKLLILDGNSVLNRAYYGIRDLTTRTGLHTNAIQGFLNMMDKLLKQEQPEALCVAFDLHGPTFRHRRYEQYKATRHGMPEELAQQLPVMKQVLGAMHIPIYTCEGWEADDVIGTVARRCGEADWDCVIATGDRDSLQLIDEHVKVKLAISRPGQTDTTLYGEKEFLEQYGFAPIHLIDLKSLMGDSSDNIPGVPGVGPKTATELLLKYHTLDGVYENLSPENMRGKLFEKLSVNREMAYLSYELATIRCDAPIDFAPEDCLRREPNRRELYELLTKLEFVRLIDKYGLRGAEREQSVKEAAPMFSGECTSEMVPDKTHAQALLDAYEVAQCVPALLLREGTLLCVQSDTQMSFFSAAVLNADYLSVLKRFFNGKTRILTHGSKEMTLCLLKMGLEPRGIVFDTEVAAYLLEPSRGSYALGELTQSYLQFSLPTANSMQQAGCTDAEAAFLGEAASACAAIEALHEPLLRKLREIGSEQLYFDLELPLCPVLAKLEYAGIAVDEAALSDFSALLAQRLTACEQLIYGLAGVEFNINSPKQLGEILFDKLRLPSGKKTKTGYSTNVDVLEKLKGFPVVRAVMDFRTLSKLKSTYADGLQKVIDDKGRIHTTFQNTVTATGRLSSTEPNLQNIPVRTELGSEIRKMFIPRPGWVLVDADYSQIELRVLAHIADDKAMQEAFRSGQDFHTVTASQVFGVRLDEVTPRLRRAAKAVNFGIVYGISEFSLAEDIGVSRYEAKEYIDSYLNRYSGVRAYMKNVVEQARANGYVTTLYGRRRYLPELNNSKYLVRSGAERMAMNTPIQGTAADIIKRAMLLVQRALEQNELQAIPVLQVHDELIVECPPFEAELVMQLLTERMQHAAVLKVPLIAEAKLGSTWYEAK